jgi:metallophosphoesterase superfamily enzyme
MRFLYNAPAIFHKGALIVGDTHFGIEERLRKNGIFVTNLSMKLLEKLKRLLKTTKAKRLIILGDVKDKIGICDETTKKIFEELKKLNIEIIIVRGNHDGGIEKVGAKVVDADGFVYEGLGLIHGHSWPSKNCMNCRYIISAHQHPLVEHIDAAGKHHSMPAWIILEANERNIERFYKKFNKKIKLILLPPFNQLVGTTLNYGTKEHLGPLFKNKLFKYNDAIVYTLDGKYLGKILSNSRDCE